MKDIFQKIKLMKVLTYFLDNPDEEIYPSKLAKVLKMNVVTVSRKLDELKKLGFLESWKVGNLRMYRARHTLKFKFAKILLNITRIENSGLIEAIKDMTTNLHSVILYGSFAKGTNRKDSDVDLVIICDSHNIDVEKLEKLIGREIELKVFKPAEWIRLKKTNPGFYNDVMIYGIALYGDKPVI